MAKMVRNLPFGKAGVAVSFPENLEVEWVQPDYGPGAADPAALLAERLRHPIGMRPLEEQARSARRVTIIIDDITRPTPTRQMLPVILKELNNAGVEPNNVRIIVGVGSHRTMTPAEMETIAGRKIFSRYAVINHEARNPQHLVEMGRSPRGIPVQINKLVIETDLAIITGFIKPHNVAGYSGGYKGYFPAVAGIETIVGLHALQQLPGEPCRLGEMDNPFRAELDAMGLLVPTPAFLLNTIINREKQIVDAFAGHPIEAHRAAVAKAGKLATVPVSRPADIVLACGGGFPSDISLYQGVNALTSVVRLRRPLVKPDGCVILFGEFREGLGLEFGGGRHKDLATAWASHLRKMRRLTVVSPNVPQQALEAAGIAKADSAEEAIAQCAAGYTAPHLLVMPDAPYTVGRA
jgi:nickel-dependent lactate racemase